MNAWIPVLLVGALGCVPASRPSYDWGGYEKSMYDLMRNPRNLEAYGLALRAQIERNPDGRRVPPGIYAEYGYVLYCAGNKVEARTYFEREKARWPESARLMDRMIANCAAPPPPPVSGSPEVPVESVPAPVKEAP